MQIECVRCSPVYHSIWQVGYRRKDIVAESFLSSWCSGSTSDFDSDREGSNPSEEVSVVMELVDIKPLERASDLMPVTRAKATTVG